MLAGSRQKEQIAVVRDLANEVSAFNEIGSDDLNNESGSEIEDGFIKCEACGELLNDAEYEDHLIAHKLHQNMLEK